MPQAPVAVGASSQPRSGYRKALYSTGISQVVLGALTAVLGIVTATALNSVPYFSDHGSPIWCGLLFYAVAGILGIMSGSKKNSGLVRWYMIMSILACLAACCVIGYSSAAEAFYTTRCRHAYRRYYYDYDRGHRYESTYPSYCSLQAAYQVVYATLIILGIVEFVVAIVGASLTCGAVCSSTSSTTNNVALENT